MLFDFGDLDPIFKVTGGLRVLEKSGVASCPHSISLLIGQILTKLTQIYHWEKVKCGLEFGDLDLIFKVTGGIRLLENGLSASYLL